MNWKHLRRAPWLDTRARFVASTPSAGSLLDIGSSDGETLRHFAELRPDLRFFATDIMGQPEKYPAGCQFHRGDLQREKLPWPDATFDAITCMHLVEHLTDLSLLFKEVSRILKPGGRIYFETPHPKTLCYTSSIRSPVTINFYDDGSHTRPMAIGALAHSARHANLAPLASGTSRNLIFAAAWPFYLFAKPSRQKYTARIHWLGWSAYMVAQRQTI